MSGKVAAAVPYSWEAAPGKPMQDIVETDYSNSTVLLRTPLPPPPGSRGVRRPLTFVEPTFGGFEPEPHELVGKSSGTHLGEKLFKKLQTKLRKKSKVLAASFSVDNIRALAEQMKRTTVVAVEEDEYSNVVQQSRGAYNEYSSSDELRVGGSWSSSLEQPDTPSCSSSSTDHHESAVSLMNSMSSMSSLSNASTSWESIGNHSASLHQLDGPQLINVVDMNLLSMSATSCDSDFQDDEEPECLSGPRESAWHEEVEVGEEEEEELTEREWQIVRYASLQGDNANLISTLVRQSSLTPVSDHSYRFSPIKGRKSERQ